MVARAGRRPGARSKYGRSGLRSRECQPSCASTGGWNGAAPAERNNAPNLSKIRVPLLVVVSQIVVSGYSVALLKKRCAPFNHRSAKRLGGPRAARELPSSGRTRYELVRTRGEIYLCYRILGWTRFHLMFNRVFATSTARARAGQHVSPCPDFGTNTRRTRGELVAISWRSLPSCSRVCGLLGAVFRE